MKAIKIGFLLVVLLVFNTACDDEFEKTNTNPNAVTKIDPEYLFANACLQTMRGNGNKYLQFPFATQYAHIYSGQNNSMFIDRYYDNFTSHEYRDVFEGFYYGPIRHVQEVLRLTKPGGDYENPVRYAMARIIAVMNLVQLSDAFGSIPYRDGGLGQEGNLYPEYDSVETIYKDALDELKNAITVLNTASSADGFPGADPIFSNNLENWRRFANSLRLRYAMRIRFVTEEKSYAENIIKECLAAPLIEENSQNVVNENQDSDIGEFQNPVYSHYDYWKWKMSAFFVDRLKLLNDPRLEVFVKPNTAGEFVGLPNGLSNSALPDWDLNTVSSPADNLVGKAAPFYFMSAAEIWLLRAEAALAGISQENANQLYQTGIRKSLEQWQVDETIIDTYLAENTNSTLNGSTEHRFEQVCTQVWISVLPNAMEGWNTIRRTGYPKIQQREAPDFDLGITNGNLPVRLRYPSSEVNINHSNYLKALEMQGEDLITTKLWWDVKN
ncbi:SusD/RagB family nutrient-binding outer membrane lipoprotein [Maribellus luteus]|uniref:SusD/RagB family nutrient-binding outer membrane lipoprotein n=1 Tax=Maribellus luteus TaxID=2305463 RepID=A0A399T3W7_9BACT|nr:SusD/RagB family nutrient-binding outer membrane lipoprotein [Maribellus luteus]RIJ50568.1 SusD/RagB family nutrient-binding outer membrane lipoprotein [Maribellus luteus]